MIKRYALTLSLLAVLAIIAVTVGTLIYPTAREIIDLNRRIEQEKSSLEARYFQRTKVRSTIEHLSEVKDGISEIRSMTLPSGHEVELIEAIEKVASVNGVNEKIRLVPPQTGSKDYGRKLVTELTLTGDSRKIGRFLSDLQRMDRLFVATNVSLRKNKETSVVTATVAGWVSWPEEAPQE